MSGQNKRWEGLNSPRWVVWLPCLCVRLSGATALQLEAGVGGKTNELIKKRGIPQCFWELLIKEFNLRLFAERHEEALGGEMPLFGFQTAGGDGQDKLSWGAGETWGWWEGRQVSLAVHTTSLSRGSSLEPAVRLGGSFLYSLCFLLLLLVLKFLT